MGSSSIFLKGKGRGQELNLNFLDQLQDPIAHVITNFLPGSIFAGSWNQELGQNNDCTTSAWNTCVTTKPNAYLPS